MISVNAARWDAARAGSRSSDSTVAARMAGVQSCCSSSGTTSRPASKFTMATCGTRIMRRAMIADTAFTR